MSALNGDNRLLLLGVTGGIATGKSTVARYLQDRGALTIDFDVLARVVQKPGKPAYSDIVDYFGKGVTRKDGSLDRDKLSRVVFADPEKKKKLEGFTHPRIAEAYLNALGAYSSREPDAIVQVVVPLLIEVNMQSGFDRILVVYAPEAEQVRRLQKRDGISEARARAMVASQLSIEEKKAHADFLVDNSKSPEHTERQVEALWQTLQKLRR